MFTDEEIAGLLPMLNRFSMKLHNGNRTQAEDLVQDTVLRAMENHDKFQPGSNLKGWAGKIMYNLFITRYRRSTKFDSRYHDEKIFDWIPVHARQEDIVFANEVAQHMRALPTDFKDIAMLAGEGLSYEEIADISDIPIGTVRSRLCRAREMLQLELSDAH